MGDLTVDTYTTDDGRYRIRIEYDDGPSSPREFDNTTEMVGLHSRYNLGDRQVEGDEQDALERGGWPLLKRYLQLSKHAIAIAAVGMYDHSGISLYPMSGPDEFSGTDTQWDHSTAAFIYTTRERHEEMAGGDPLEEVEISKDLVSYVPELRVRKHLGEEITTLPRVWANLYGELMEYSDFVEGKVYRYVIEKRVDWKRADDEDDEMSTWETEDSCSGYIGESEYAMSEAKEVLDSITKQQPEPAITRRS